MDFLKKILDHKHKLNKEKSDYYSLIKEKISQTKYTRYSLFKKQITKKEGINIIAEIKKASPSKGLIRADFDLLQIAKIYEENNAAAISVLTEDKYFLGNPNYIKKVHEAVSVPILCKDFIIDEGQIYEARINGASAVLLITAILDDATIQKFLDLATSLDVDCVLEVHDEKELKRALASSAEIIGINNRNLTTFETSIVTCLELMPDVPDEKVVIVESGFEEHYEVLGVTELGANAVLIGEAFMKEKDIGKKIREIYKYSQNM